MDEDQLESYMARNNEIVEREICPKCGEPWQEPGGVSLDYNYARLWFTTTISDRDLYLQDLSAEETWEAFVAENIDDPSHYLVCASCIRKEGALPAERGRWYREDGVMGQDDV